MITESERREYLEAIAARGLDTDFELNETRAPIVITGDQLIHGAVKITRKSTCTSRFYRSGSYTPWPVAFADDLSVGIFDSSAG